MKSFKLVATGVGILMYILLVTVKTNTGSVKQVMQNTSAKQQEIAAQQIKEEDDILVYPSCLPAALPYQ